jgi:hypothetical protein
MKFLLCFSAITFLVSAYFTFRLLDSSVGIALSYRLDYRGSRVPFPAGAGKFSPHHHVQNISRFHTASHPKVLGAFSLGESGRGVKLTTHLHLVLRSNNERSHTSTPQYAFVAWCSVKSQGNFTFTFYLLTYLLTYLLCGAG